MALLHILTRDAYEAELTREVQRRVALSQTEQ